ncbi:MAG: DUF5709 domain-containing protein [Mycobacteriales bacterium]
MSSRIPDPGDPLEDEGVPGQESGLAAKRVTGDTQDDMVPPAEQPVGVDRFGTTAAELAEGEDVNARLRQERMDIGHGDPGGEPYPEDLDERAGRLTQAALAPPDVDSMTGQNEGADAGGYSAEESAMHTTENP